MVSKKKRSPKRAAGHGGEQGRPINGNADSTTQSINAEPKPETPDAKSKSPKAQGFENIIANWTRVLGVSTVFLVIATGISAYFLWQTDHTLQETARKQLRAYLFFELVGFTVSTSEKTITADITIKNGGLTPAYNVQSKTIVMAVDYPLKGGRIPINLGTSPVSAKLIGGLQNMNVIGPGGTSGILAQSVPTLKFDPEEVVSGERKRALAVSAVYYKDVFGVDHYAHYCIIAAKFSTNIGVLCAEGNDADKH